MNPGAHPDNDPRVQAPLDREALVEQCMGDPVLALTVLEKFEQQLRADVECIAACLREQDLKGISRTAHSLKGAAGMVKAMSVCEQAARVETASRAGTGVSEAFTRLRDEVNACIAAAVEIRRTLRAGRGESEVR